MISKHFGLFVIFFLAALCSNAYSGGLKSKMGEVWLENVRYGKAFSIKESLNMSVKVTNTSATPLELKMELFINKKGDSDLKEGYEPLPDPSWIKIEREYFPKVEPNTDAETDVIIEIPKDNRYLGKKYQFYVWTRSVSGLKNINVGVMSRFLITVISADNLAILEGRKKPDIIKANLDFSLLPYEIFAKQIRPGKKYDIEVVAGSAIKVVNPNSEKMKFKIYPLTTDDAKTFLKKGYEDFPEAGLLTFKESEFEVPAESIKRVKAFLQFPVKDTYKDRKYQCIIVLEALDQNVNARVYSRLYVTTGE